MADTNAIRAMLFGAVSDEESSGGGTCNGCASLWGEEDVSVQCAEGENEVQESRRIHSSRASASAPVEFFQAVRTPPPKKVSVESILKQMSLEERAREHMTVSPSAFRKSVEDTHVSRDDADTERDAERDCTRKKVRKGLFECDSEDSDSDIFLDSMGRDVRQNECDDWNESVGSPEKNGLSTVDMSSIDILNDSCDSDNVSLFRSGALTPGPNMGRANGESATKEGNRRKSWGGSEVEDPLFHPLHLGLSESENAIGAIVNECDDCCDNSVTPAKEKERNFEAFLVVGVEGERVNDQFPPRVLFQYPDNASTHLPINKLVEFCFPAGVDRSVSPRICDFTTEMIFGMSYLHSVGHCFVFMLTGGDHGTLYGVCASRVEPVDLLPSFIQEASAEEWKRRRGACQVAPRIYCLVSRHPYFTLHYDIIYGVIAHERLIRMNCEFHPKEEVADGSGRLEVLEILQCYYNARVPVPGERFHLKMPFEHRDLSFFCPLGDTIATVLAQWCIVVAFRALSLDNIICLFSAAFQERQIVVISNNLGLLSFTILSVLPMLRPLEWQGLLVPVIPASLKTMCHAPVPFLIGVSSISTKEKRLLHSAGVVLVDIDRNLVLLPDDLPQLPDAKRLYKDLKVDYSRIHDINESSDNPYYTNNEELHAVQNVRASIARYCNWLLDSICQHFMAVTDANDYEQRDQVRIGIVTAMEASGGCADFMRGFLDTQHFSHYLDNWLKKQIALY